MAFFSDARFPQELRDHIWRFAVEVYPSRIVELTGRHENTFCTSEGEIVPVEYSFVSSAPIPATLHACSRSREISKKRWTLTFDSISKPVDKATVQVDNLPLLPRTWFDFESDTLFFMEDSIQHPSSMYLSIFIRDIQSATQQRIQNVIYNFEPSDVEEDDFWSDWEMLLCLQLQDFFPGLRNFSLSELSRVEADGYLRYDLKDSETVAEGAIIKYTEIMDSTFLASFSLEHEEGSAEGKMVRTHFR